MASSSASAAAAHHDSKPGDTTTTTQSGKEGEKQNVTLEEDDEFEDFPVEDWGPEDTEAAAGGSAHLWEESWDDDDTSDDFSKQLKEELDKVKAGREK